MCVFFNDGPTLLTRAVDRFPLGAGERFVPRGVGDGAAQAGPDADPCQAGPFLHLLLHRRTAARSHSHGIDSIMLRGVFLDEKNVCYL